MKLNKPKKQKLWNAKHADQLQDWRNYPSQDKYGLPKKVVEEKKRGGGEMLEWTILC